MTQSKLTFLRSCPCPRDQVITRDIRETQALLGCPKDREYSDYTCRVSNLLALWSITDNVCNGDILNEMYLVHVRTWKGSFGFRVRLIRSGMYLSGVKLSYIIL